MDRGDYYRACETAWRRGLAVEVVRVRHPGGLALTLTCVGRVDHKSLTYIEQGHRVLEASRGRFA